MHNETSHSDKPYINEESLVYFNYHKHFQSKINTTTSYILF